MMSRGSLRGTPAVITPRRFSSSSDSSTGAQPLGFMHHQGEYTDSVTSFTSDLESIVEESRSRRRKRAPPPVAEDTDEERREEEEDKEMCRRERRRTLSKLESKRPYTPADDDGRAASLRASSQGAGSPTRAQFGDTLKLIRHSPLARSVSPAKSALKHPCSPSPEDGKRAHVRVSFSDEDSIASFSIMRPPVAIDVAPPPTLPVFSRVRKESQRGRTQEQDKRRRRSAVIVEPALSKVTSSEPVSTDDEGYDEDDDEVHKMVPEFVLTEPTPREEKQQSVQSTGEPEAPPAPTSVPGQFPASPPPEESDSEIDVFHDAFEMLPASGSKSNLLLPTITEMSGPAHPQLTRAPPSPPPQTPISTAPSSSISPRSLIPPMPPLPESFSKPTPIPSRRRSLTPPPRRRPARRAPLPPTQEILDDSESDTSVTSFRRTYARTRDSQGMRITMRAAQALTPVSSRQYSSSSDGEEEGARKMRRRLGLGIGIRKISAGSTSAGSVPVTGTWRSRFQDSSDEEGTTLPVPPPVPQTTPRRRVLRRKSSEGSGKGKLRKKSPARAEKVEKVEKTKEKDRRSIFAWVRSRSSSRSGAKLEETVVPPLPTQTPQLEAENVVVAVAEPPVEISTPETEVVAAPEITQTATAIAIATAPATKLPSSMTRPHLHLRSKLESVSFSPSTKSEDAGPAKKRGWKRIFGR